MRGYRNADTMMLSCTRRLGLELWREDRESEFVALTLASLRHSG
jgi:hypothetical protein